MESKGNRTYCRDECTVFLKTNERFGGLSNMAGGYPLSINNVRILTSEALYQACRFPHRPDVQKLIIGQISPMTAKMKSKPYRKDSRDDWDKIRVQVMYWCLRVKLVQHWEKFGELLLSTEDRPIVEESYRDPFWGAKPTDSGTLVGMNVLGRLLTTLRDELKGQDADYLRVIKPPPDLKKFLLLGESIGVIGSLEPQSSSTVISAVSEPSEAKKYEQLTSDSGVVNTTINDVEAEAIAVQTLPAEILASVSPIECELVALPLDGIEAASISKGPNKKPRRKKASRASQEQGIMNAAATN